MTSTPPLFLIVAALLATLAVCVIVLVVVRSIRREKRGFEVKPTTNRSRDGREHHR